MDHLEHIAKVSPDIFSVAALLGFIISRKPILLYYAVITFSSELANNYIKMASKWYSPDNPMFMRPNPPPEGCGTRYVMNKTWKGLSWGMPSGHTQVAFMGAVFWSLYIWNTYGDTMNTKISIIILFILACLLGYSRILNGCHNIQQILVGASLGIVFGCIGYITWNQLK